MAVAAAVAAVAAGAVAEPAAVEVVVGVVAVVAAAAAAVAAASGSPCRREGQCGARMYFTDTCTLSTPLSSSGAIDPRGTRFAPGA